MDASDTAPSAVRGSLSAFYSDDTYVSSVSNFGCEVWDFSADFCDNNRGGVRGLRIDWSYSFSDLTSLSSPSNTSFYCTLKELLLNRITHKLASRQPILPGSAVQEIWILRKLFNRMKEIDCVNMGDITQSVLDRLLSEWINSGLSRRTVVKYVLSIQLLSVYGQHLSHPLNFTPWRGRSCKRIAGFRESDSNVTEIIPDEVFEPLYKESLALLKSHKTTAAIQAWDALQRVGYIQEAIGGPPSGQAAQRRKQVVSKHGFANYHELDRFTNEMVCAGFVIVAGLSGMRDSEVKSLTEECLKVERKAEQTIRFYKVRGTTQKHKRNIRNSKGSARTWVVIEPVHDAINRLLEVKKFDFRRSGDKVFYRLASTQQMNRALNIYCRPFKDANGENWRITTGQFRRTLARWIVRRPSFGIVAGKIQFGHVSIATTQGYAAYDQPWLKELETERLAFSVDVLDELAEDITTGSVSGPRRSELLEFRGQAGERRKDEIAWMLKNGSPLGRTLHVGPYNYCFYDSSNALCKKHSDEQSGPILSFCQPSRCANSCITKKHLPVWKEQIFEAESMLNKKETTVCQASYLKADIARMRTVIGPLEVVGE